ncbi:MAG: TonB-dependent receptor [Rhodobacteraceae bacterium]|nr:TonB-dependent receptor [Paracoccaceae bacterium]
MRLHPNSELAINQVSDTQASLELNSGKVWARTPRETNRPITVQTPSAAAAIRGTDWTLSVDTPDVTSVFVYDGQVDLSNAQGAVSAAAGAGVSASRGQAPRSVQVLNLTERQQMLFSVTAGAAANAIIQFEDALEGQGAAPAAYREGIALLRAGQFDLAATRLARAAPALDPRRAAAARWIAAFARAEAGAPISGPAPGGTDVDTFARAYLSAYSGDLAGTAAQLAPLQTSPVALADAVRMAVYLDRFDEARRHLRQLQALAPDSAQALSAEAFVLSVVEGNPSNAVPLYRRAVALDPENPTLRSRLAMAEHTVGHPIEAEAALRKALTLAPGDADILANLVVVLLDQSRVAEAQRIADQLAATSPGSYTTLMARARVDASMTDLLSAEESALRALAAQPGVAENSILLAIAAHHSGNDARAQQELDAAKRLDPNDPNIPAIRGTIALDYARADEAIVAALEAERLFRQGLAAERQSADRKSGSILTAAFQNIGLTDWARDIADRSHDPLSASSLFSEALTPRSTIAFEPEASDPSDSIIPASELQGLLLDPLGALGRLRFSDIQRKPFLDAEIAVTVDPDDPRNLIRSGVLTGFSTLPVPFGVYIDGTLQTAGVRADPSHEKRETGTIMLVAEPSARIGALAFGVKGRQRNGVSGVFDEDGENEFGTSGFEYLGLGIALRLQERRVLSFYASSIDIESVRTVEDNVGTVADPQVFSERRSVWKKTNLYAIGYRADDVRGTWFAGIEHFKGGLSFQVDRFVAGFGLVFPAGSFDGSSQFTGTRLYVQRRHDFGGRFEIVGDFGLSYTRTKFVDALFLPTPDVKETYLKPRVALGATLAPGHRIRVASIHDVTMGRETLAPVASLGLFPIGAPTDDGGTTNARIFRYDGTFSEWLHLSVEHQSVNYTKLSFDSGDIETDIDEATLRRTEIRGEMWLGSGVGAFASVARARSNVISGDGQGFGILGVPEREAAVGFTWVHPSQVKLSAQARHLGVRVGDIDGSMLDPVWTVDMSLTWQSPDKRMQLSLEAQNLFDADFQRSFDLESVGRSFSLSAAMRF